MAVTVSLVAAVAGTGLGLVRATAEAERANQEAETARQVSDFLVGLFEASDPFAESQGDFTVRELLERGTDEIERGLADEPRLQARLLATIGQVHTQLGLYEAARTLLDDALATQQSTLDSSDPQILRTQIRRAWLATQTGEYEHALDNKNRLFVSNKLRNQIDTDEHGSSFYLIMGTNGVLCLYPEKYFQQIALAGAPRMAAPDEAVAFERLAFALASKVELDRQGRLLLSEKIRKRARLGSALTLVGVRDHIELWNTDNWEKYLSDNFPQYQQQMAVARQAVLQKESRQLDV